MIPAILAVKRAAASFGSLTDMVNQELKPTIRELTTVLTELKTVGNGMAEQTDDVKRFMSALGETGDNLHTINRTVGAVTSVFATTSVWVTGLRVAGKYALERYLKKRGGK
jgi:methyl-accepting chemotaxis protein